MSTTTQQFNGPLLGQYTVLAAGFSTVTATPVTLTNPGAVGADEVSLIVVSTASTPLQPTTLLAGQSVSPGGIVLGAGQLLIAVSNLPAGGITAQASVVSSV
jgi:hypothetical protein